MSGNISINIQNFIAQCEDVYGRQVEGIARAIRLILINFQLHSLKVDEEG